MVIVVLGATGSGKTTIGRALAAALGWPFLEGDECGPNPTPAPLRGHREWTMNDEAVLLDAVHKRMTEVLDRREHLVVACPVLTTEHRRLRGGLKLVRFVYLKADAALLASRIGSRSSPSRQARIIQTQWSELEDDAEAIAVDAALTPDAIVVLVRRECGV